MSIQARSLWVKRGSAAVVFGVAGIWAISKASGPATSAPYAKVPFTVEKETTNITGPLLEDGRVDYMAALNEKYAKGVTLENNGFVTWLKVVGTGENIVNPKVKDQLLKMCGAQEIPVGLDTWVTYEDFLKQERGLNGDKLTAASESLAVAGSEMWIAEDHPDVAAFVKSREKQLSLVVEVTGKPKWWIPYVAMKGHSMCSVVLPALGTIREAGNALVARAMLRMKAGDFDGFLGDVIVAKKLARQVGSGATIIERLTGVGIERHATAAIGVVAGRGALSEAQCKKASAALTALGDLPAMSDAVDVMERWETLEYAASVSVWDKDSIEKIPGRTWDPVAEFGKIDRDYADWDTVLRFINGLQDETVRALQNQSFQTMSKEIGLIDQRIIDWGPALEKKQSFGRTPGETRAAYTERMGKTFVYLLRAALWKAEVLSRWAGMEDDMLRVVLAAAEGRGRTGKWPAKLEELVPGMLKDVPRDIHSKDSAEAVKYVVTENGVRVYSVGQNGVDEGGKFNAEKKAKEEKEDDLGVGVEIK